MKLETFDDDLPELPDDEQLKSQGPRPYLEETRTLKKYPVPNYPMFIGRDKKGSVCIPVAAVSRRHAKIFEREGKFFLQDEGSLNGTFLNGKRIIETAEITDGDRVLVAKNKEYPRGVKEFVFRSGLTEEQRQEEEKRKEEERKRQEDQKLLAELGVQGRHNHRQVEKIPLGHCQFYVSKRDLMAVLGSEKNRRVALEKMDLEKEEVDFLSLYPFKIKEQLTLTIKHPKIARSIKLPLRVTEVSSQSPYNVLLHKTSIIRLTDEIRKILDNLIEPGFLISYVNSEVKE